jgi:DNA helicase-2/ATP-dependent DNA helicase PcrA
MIDYLEENDKTRNEIILNRRGIHQLIAPAGAGKSSTIIARIVNTLKDEPSAIIVGFAFNNFASEQLNFRLKKALEKEGLSSLSKNIFIGTIHQFCLNYLKKYNPHFSDYTVLDDMTRFAFVSKKNNYNTLELYSLPKLDLPFYNKTRQNTRRVQTINVFLKSCDIVREEDEDVNALSASKEFVTSYLKYLELLDNNNYFDFSGLLYRFVSEIKLNIDFKNQIKESFDYLIVDEYQDINSIQEEIIKILSNESNLLVVGDEDQTIYQFRGSNINHFLTFPDRYPNVQKHLFTINYRSSSSIVQLSDGLVKINQNRTNKSIFPNPHNIIHVEEGDLIMKSFDNDEEELRAICLDIKNKISLDFENSKKDRFCITPSDICILVRTNSSAKRVSEIFLKEGIPFVSSNPGLLLSQPEIKFIIDCIFFVFDLIPGMGQYIEDVPLVRMYQDIFDINEFEDGYFSDVYFMSNYESTFNLYSSSDFFDNLIKYRESFEKIKTFELQKFYHGLLSVIGSERFDFNLNQLNNLSKFSSVISSFESNYSQPKKSDIFQFVEFLWGYVMDNTEIGGFEKNVSNQNAVNIITIHKAKGLEFPVVYIPHLIKKLFPAFSHKPVLFLKEDLELLKKYQGEIEDERRLFYVALTRAEKFLWLSYSHKTKDVNSLPSNFIKELDLALFNASDTTARTKNTYPQKSFDDTLITNQGELRYYIQCPYSYHLRFGLGFDPFLPFSYGYGKQIHKIIDILHKKFNSKQPTKEDINKIVDEEFFLRFSTGELYQNMKKSALNLLWSYVEDNPSFFQSLTQTEVQFEYFIDDSIVKGSIDLISKEGNENILIDVKTDENTDFKKYIDQVRIYTLACNENLGIKINKAFIYEIKENVRHKIEIESNDLIASRQKYINVLNGIKSNNYTPNPSKECLSCDMKMLCKYKTTSSC